MKVQLDPSDVRGTLGSNVPAVAGPRASYLVGRAVRDSYLRFAQTNDAQFALRGDGFRFAPVLQCPLISGRNKTPRANPQVEDVVEINVEWL